MQETCTTVIALWEQLYSPTSTQEVREEAESQLKQFLRSVDSIPALIAIEEAEVPPEIKRRAIIYLKISMKNHRYELKEQPDIVISLQQKLFEFCQAQLNINTKKIICEELITNANYPFYESILNKNDLLPFAETLLQSPSKNIYFTGLIIISNIIIDKEFPLELIDNSMVAAFDIYQNTQARAAESDATYNDLHSIATELLSNLLAKPVFDSNPEKLAPLCEYLLHCFNEYAKGAVISAANPKESLIEWTDFFTLLSCLIEHQTEFFEQNLTSSLEGLLANLNNDSLSIEFRTRSMIAFVPAAYFLPEVIIPNLPTYLMQTMHIALAAYHEDHDIQSIYIPSEFYAALEENLLDYIDSSELFELICKVIEEISKLDDISKFLAIFVLIEPFEECFLSEFIDQFEMFTPIIDEALSTGDPDTVEAAARFLKALSTANSTLLCNILDEFGLKLLNFIESDIVLETLEEIYRQSDKEISFDEYAQIITALCACFQQEELNSYHIEKVVGCIAYLNLLVSPDSQETLGKIAEIFSSVRPFLLQLLASENTSLIGPTIFCFSTFSNQNHEMVKDDIPSLADIIIKSIPMKDHELNKFCANAILNFVDMYPQSFAVYSPTILTEFVELIGNREADEETIRSLNDEEEDDDEAAITENNRRRVYVEMFTEVLVAISVIFSTYAEQMAEQSDKIVEILLQTISSEDQINVVEDYYQSYMRSCNYIIPSLISINKDPSQLIEKYLELHDQFSLSDFANDIIEFWDNLKVIIAKAGTPFLIKYGQQIFDLYSSVFNNTRFKDVYSKSSNKFIMRQEFSISLTTFGCQFFYQYGGSNWTNLFADPETRQQIEQANPAAFAQAAAGLVEIMTTNSKKLAAPGACILSVIITTCSPACDALLPNVLQLIIPSEISSNDYNSRESAYDALNHLLFSGNQQYLDALAGVENLVPTLLESALEVIGQSEKFPVSLIYSANNLWCGLVMAYNLDASADVFEKVKSNIPQKPNSSFLEFNVQFAIYANQRWPDQFNNQSLLLVAIAIFASDDQYIRKVKIEHMGFLASILQQTPDDMINNELQSNENMIMTLEKHVQLVSQLSSSS